MSAIIVTTGITMLVDWVFEYRALFTLPHIHTYTNTHAHIVKYYDCTHVLLYIDMDMDLSACMYAHSHSHMSTTHTPCRLLGRNPEDSTTVTLITSTSG